MKPYNQSRDTVEVNEKFMVYDTKTVDSKFRVTLGERLVKQLNPGMKIDLYRVLICKNGDILLRPSVSIPSKEAWIYRDADSLNKIRKGLEEAKIGKVRKVKNLDSFLKKL